MFTFYTSCEYQESEGFQWYKMGTLVTNWLIKLTTFQKANAELLQNVKVFLFASENSISQ